MNLRRLVVILFCLLIFSFTARAQEPAPLWGEGGVLVNDSRGNTDQKNPKILADGSGGYFIVFEDTRQGHLNIYAQRIDDKGQFYFGKDGLPICEAPGDQTFPRIVSDGTGGAVVTWQDSRDGNFDIYAQRFNAQGRLLWQIDGVPVCNIKQNQVFPVLVYDGNYGVIVAWYDYRFGSEDIYAQKLRFNGERVWGEEGVPICRAKKTQWYPQIVSDEQGGAIICWTDRRSGNFDIYVQRVNESGKTLWQQDGVPAVALPSIQEKPSMVSDSKGGAYLAWSDFRSGASGIYVQRIDAKGILKFDLNGVPAIVGSVRAQAPQIAKDRSQGFFLVWSDSRAGDQDIYVQHFSKDGKRLWGNLGRPLIMRRGDQKNPKIYGTEPWTIVWEDLREYKKKLYLQQISSSGFFVFPNSGILISGKGLDPESPDIAYSPGLEPIVVFQDKRFGGFDVFAQKIGKGGALLWGMNGLLVNGTPGSVVQQNLAITEDSLGNYIFAFEDFRNGVSNIYLQKVGGKGELLWEKDAVAAARSSYAQKNPEVIQDGQGGAIVCWEGEIEGENYRIFCQRVSKWGNPVWGEKGLLLSPGVRFAEQTQPSIVSDKKGGAIIIYTDYRGTYNFQDIFAQRVSSQGKLLWGGQGLAVSTSSGNQNEAQISQKNLVVAWTDYRNGDRNSDIYAQKLALEGRVLWQEDGVPVCEAPDSQRNPEIIDNGEKGIIVTWTDKGGGSYDIYAQRLDYYGRPLWIKDGIPVNQSARTQQNPKITLVSPAQALLVWEDFRFGNWDIYAQKLDDSGRILFAEGGVPISRALGTQYAPHLVKAIKGSIIAWEDYRSGSAYNIYLQRLGETGEILWGEEGYLARDTLLGARSPQLLRSSGGSFVLAWEDYRDSGRAIFAQKFTF